MSGWRLVADVGGTNVRLAQAWGGQLRERRNYAVAAYPSFIAAAAAYFAEFGTQGLSGIAIGAAGPVENGAVQLTNAPWLISGPELAADRRVPAAVINDLQAAALCIPHLAGLELEWIGLEPAGLRHCGRAIAINAGTGFGAAALIWHDGAHLTCPGEAGHMTLGAASPDEMALRGAFSCVEDVLSGRGVTRLYAHYNGGADDGLDAASIFAHASGNPAAARTVATFTQILARTAGDLTLASAAWDGVYLFGSVAAGWARAADHAAFRAIFEDKGAMSGRMRNTPAALVIKEDAALYGLAHMSLAAGGVNTPAPIQSAGK